MVSESCIFEEIESNPSESSYFVSRQGMTHEIGGNSCFGKRENEKAHGTEEKKNAKEIVVDPSIVRRSLLAPISIVEGI